MAKIDFSKSDLMESLLNVSPLTLHQLQNTDIVIIGQPASGKTYLADLLKGEKQDVIHTDDFLQKGVFLESLDGIFDAINQSKGRGSLGQIVEGVGGYRLLRKGVETGQFFPKVVINLQITEFKSEWIYKTERPDKDYKKVLSMMKGNAKVLDDWANLYNPHPPIFLTVLNRW